MPGINWTIRRYLTVPKSVRIVPDGSQCVTMFPIIALISSSDSFCAWRRRERGKERESDWAMQKANISDSGLLDLWTHTHWGGGRERSKQMEKGENEILKIRTIKTSWFDTQVKGGCVRERARPSE